MPVIPSHGDWAIKAIFSLLHPTILYIILFTYLFDFYPAFLPVQETKAALERSICVNGYRSTQVLNGCTEMVYCFMMNNG